MSTLLLAEFDEPGALKEAARRVSNSRHRVVDAFTPFPVEGLDEVLDTSAPRLPTVMLVAGLVAAALFYALQWWSAVHAYPLNVGGRPLHSWPVFLLVPFEVGMLAAALGGVIALCRACGLPRLHHPVFAVSGFERASQDRFFLLAEDLRGDGRLRMLLADLGALSVTEVRS